MEKTVKEIKRGLECCYSSVEPIMRCEQCPYYGSIVCKMRLHTDALALIQQLEATVSEKEKVVAELSGKIGRLEGKLDEAINDLHRAVNCPATLVACEFCKNNEVCSHDGTCDAVENDRWQWRGISKEGH